MNKFYSYTYLDAVEKGYGMCEKSTKELKKWKRKIYESNDKRKDVRKHMKDKDKDRIDKFEKAPEDWDDYKELKKDLK